MVKVIVECDKCHTHRAIKITPGGPPQCIGSISFMGWISDWHWANIDEEMQLLCSDCYEKYVGSLVDVT